MSTVVEERTKTRGPSDDLGGNWRVIVLNDSHNTFDHVAYTIAGVVPGVNVERGYQIADKIHTSGRATVWSGHREIAELYHMQLEQARLTMAPLERC